VQEIRRINVGGTSNVLRAALSAGVERLVHLSTTDVYGYPGTPAVAETHVAERFTNWYAQTKALAESEVRRVGRDGQLETVILRPATVYGPRSKDVIGDMARAIRGNNMLLIDRGRPNAGLCYVENLLDAMLLVIHAEAGVGEAFNVTDGFDVSWKQFTDDLADGLGSAHVRWSAPYWAAYAVALALELGYRGLRRTTGLRTPPLLSRQAVHVLGKSQDFSNRKLRALGWQPRVDYESGLAATLEWLRTELLAR
jgi:nucleoside-diphosphate-sugar epimerase